jgi:hypothetical protein
MAHLDLDRYRGIMLELCLAGDASYLGLGG